MSVLLNQGLNILKTCISKTHICCRLILASKPHGVLNLKPLFRPINVNLKCFADLERYNFPEDVAAAPSNTKTSLKMDLEVQATSSSQQSVPRITPCSCWNIARAGRSGCRRWVWRGGILRREGSFPPAASPSLSAGVASEVSLLASTPAFITINYNLALL